MRTLTNEEIGTVSGAGPFSNFFADLKDFLRAPFFLLAVLDMYNLR